MPRSVNSVASRERRRRILKQTKGYFGRRKNVWTVAVNAYEKAKKYAYRDRKNRKREFRRLWIARINAACKLNGTSYSRFINGLANANIQVNRKMLAEMAVNDQEGFKKLVELANKAKPKAKKAENVVVLRKEAKKN